MALLVAIEGIDGSGKGTQAGRLVERLAADGRRVQLISFPRYGETLFGRAVGDFLNGRFGKLDEVNPFLVSLLYAGDRFESRELLAQALAAHDVVVLDRYVASNSAHQGSKVTGEERTKLLDWIEQIEHGIYALPRPDLTILLDLPAADAQQLIARKQARGYTDKQADLHEADAAYLDSVRAVYVEFAQRPDWQRVDVFRNGTLRPIEEIGDEIYTTVQKTLTGEHGA